MSLFPASLLDKAVGDIPLVVHAPRLHVVGMVGEFQGGASHEAPQVDQLLPGGLYVAGAVRSPAHDGGRAAVPLPKEAEAGMGYRQDKLVPPSPAPAPFSHRASFPLFH